MTEKQTVQTITKKDYNGKDVEKQTGEWVNGEFIPYKTSTYK